jgi:hypothetical protein
MKKKQTNPWQLVALFSSAIFEVIILTIGGAWIGRQLDALWNVKPIGTVIGVLGGLLVGLVTAVTVFKAFTREDSK